MSIQVTKLSYRIEDRSIIQSICLDVKEGEFVGLIGPNGSGKSTLLKNMYRVLKPESGQVVMDGQDLFRMKHKETAQQQAVVTQESSAGFDFKVRDMVMMGRYPHKKIFEADMELDRSIVEEALQRVGMLKDAERSFSTLSGGEKQRVIIARALAQQARFLILDEPTNHLDVRHQLQIMDLVKTLRLTSLAALHDLNIAAFYCDRIYVLKGGKLVTSGSPDKVITPELLFDVFGVTADIVRHPITGKLSITFLPGMLTSGQNTNRLERGSVV